MPEETTLKVENVIIALNNIEKWCHQLALALEGLGRDTEIKIQPELHTEIIKAPPQGMTDCK